MKTLVYNADNMYSITFNVNGTAYNTWTDWGLIPDTPPMIPYPEPNFNFVDIPGRSGGPLDLTGKPFNKMTYKQVTGSWNFMKDTESSTARKSLLQVLGRFLNGKRGFVILSENPNYYHVGRFTISGVPKTGTGPLQFSIGYALDPVRYRVSDNTIDDSYATETVISNIVTE